MKLLRLSLSGVLGVAVTFGLLVLMYTLIANDSEFERPAETTALADIWQAETDIEDNFKKYNVKKPEENTPPPPRMAQEQAETEDVNMVMQLETPRLDGGLFLGNSGFSGNASGRPLKRVAAKYPQRALERGIEGYCIVEFTVTKEGVVFNPVVTKGVVTKENGEQKPSSIFNSECIRAARKMKFKPQIEDGEAIEYVNNYRFTFELSEDD